MNPFIIGFEKSNGTTIFINACHIEQFFLSGSGDEVTITMQSGNVVHFPGNTTELVEKLKTPLNVRSIDDLK